MKLTLGTCSRGLVELTLTLDIFDLLLEVGFEL